MLRLSTGTQSKKGKGLNALLRELSDDKEDTTLAIETELLIPDDPQRPWLRDYHAYVDIAEQVLEGWSAVQWWGVSISVTLFIIC